MARPKKVNRPVEISISIPEDLNLQMRLELFSEVEDRIPHGAISRLVETLLREYFARMKGD